MDNRARVKIANARTKQIGDAAAGLVSATLSTENMDRDGDIIRAASWELDAFMAHPVLLASHNYGSLTNQIGEWQDVHVEGESLVGVAKYYVNEGNAEADWGFALAAKGMAAYSVGFIPDFEQAEKISDEGWWPTYDFKGGTELIETSHVTVPSNRESLQNGLKAFGAHMLPGIREVHEDILKRWDEIEDAGIGAISQDAFDALSERVETLEQGMANSLHEQPDEGINERVSKWH